MTIGPRPGRGWGDGSQELSTLRFLPLSLLTTTTVVVVPAVAAWGLRRSGLIVSLVPLVAAAVAVSLTLAFGLGRAWERRPRPGGMLFSELLLWGWYGRWRQTRKLADARRVLSEAHQETVPAQRLDLLEEVAIALEAQDRYLAGHSRRVARHASLIARALQLPREDVARVRAAAAVHDVGKLFIPLEVLDKPGALTDEEFAVIRRHPDEGARLVSSLDDPALTSIVRHHHERLDGHGYPDGLSGTDIPLGARIIAVVDTFDAVTSARPYRPAASHRQALDILREASGTQLDEEAVAAFIRCYAGRRSVLVWSGVASCLQGLVGAPAQASALLRDLILRAVAVAAAATAAAGVAAPAAAGPVPRPAQQRLLASLPGTAIADPLATAIPPAAAPSQPATPARAARTHRRHRRSARAQRRAARAAHRRPRRGVVRARRVHRRPPVARHTAPVRTAVPVVLARPAPSPQPAPAVKPRPTPVVAPAPAPAGNPGVTLSPPVSPAPAPTSALSTSAPAWPTPPASPGDVDPAGLGPGGHHHPGHGRGHGDSGEGGDSAAQGEGPRGGRGPVGPGRHGGHGGHGGHGRG